MADTATRRRTLIAVGLVALVLSFGGPAPAQRQENVLNVGKYAQLSTYDPQAGPLDTLWWTGNNFYESLLDLGDDVAWAQYARLMTQSLGSRLVW